MLPMSSVPKNQFTTRRKPGSGTKKLAVSSPVLSALCDAPTSSESADPPPNPWLEQPVPPHRLLSAASSLPAPLSSSLTRARRHRLPIACVESAAAAFQSPHFTSRTAGVVHANIGLLLNWRCSSSRAPSIPHRHPAFPRWLRAARPATSVVPLPYPTCRHRLFIAFISSY
jgi:hypothetical protein